LQLQAQGVGFVAVDLAYPWIVEFNLANPGGLATIERLTGEDLAPAVVAALVSRFMASRRRPEPACR
jgi:glutathione synthase